MTEPRRVVLLDLDGTLTESGPGIIKCVIKAFEAVDVPVPNDEALQRFIGTCHHRFDEAQRHSAAETR